MRALVVGLSIFVGVPAVIGFGLRLLWRRGEDERAPAPDPHDPNPKVPPLPGDHPVFPGGATPSP